MRVFIVALPLVWLATFLWISSPLIMIQIGGIAGGAFLAAVACSALYLTRTYVDPQMRGGRFASVALWVSAIAIIALGVYSIVQVFAD